MPHVLLAGGLGAWAGPLLLERLPSCIDTRPAGRMGTRVRRILVWLPMVGMIGLGGKQIEGLDEVGEG